MYFTVSTVLSQFLISLSGSQAVSVALNPPAFLVSCSATPEAETYVFSILWLILFSTFYNHSHKNGSTVIVIKTVVR